MALKYRSEIDGLRAFAVLAVVIYHAQFSWAGMPVLGGGFIGVDVFFVISGYLITRLILSAIEKKEFSFLHFYERRARRILPALFVVMLASMPFAWTYMLPFPLTDYAWSILSSLGFVSNLYFAQGVVYAGDFSTLKPFLHTWSLSVEEQFYLIFPVILIALCHFAKSHLMAAMIILSLISLQLAQYWSDVSPDTNFYLLPSRGWELLAGAILAKLELREGKQEQIRGQSLLPTLGLAIICVSFVIFSDDIKHPSYVSVFPIIGTMFIIHYAGQGDIATKILQSRFCVMIGLISYSLYLWHVPVFAFARISDTMVTDFDKIELIAYSVLLSIITYIFIEQPFRKSSVISTKTLIISLLVTCLCIVVLCTLIISNDGYKDRMPPIIKNSYVHEPWHVMKNDRGQNCYGTYGKDDFCHFTKDGNDKTIIIVGDSNIESMSYILTSRLLEARYNVITMNSSACYFMPEFYSVMNGNPRKIENQPCDVEFQKKRLEKIKQYPNATILFGGGLDEYLTQGGYSLRSDKDILIAENYQNHVNALLNDGYEIIQLAPTPHFGKHVAQTVLNIVIHYPHVTDETMKTVVGHDLKSFEEYTRDAMDLLQSIHHPNYTVLYPHELICDTVLEGFCATNDAQNLFVFDFNHPTKTSAEMITDMIIENLEMTKRK